MAWELLFEKRQPDDSVADHSPDKRGYNLRMENAIMQKLTRQVASLTGMQLTEVQLAAWQCYENELLIWNERFNLTAIRQPEEIRLKHFIDSLSCLLVMQNTPTASVIDVGTGAGFPGLPLKIVWPEMRLTLVESVGKKADFCRHIVQTLKLEGVTVLAERVETLGQLPAHRESYDWALARAVALMPVLAEYLLPLARVGGRRLAMKGSGGVQEAQTASEAFARLGGRLTQTLPVRLPGLDEERFLVVVEKIKPTPQVYPRRVGAAVKKPLQ